MELEARYGTGRSGGVGRQRSAGSGSGLKTSELVGKLREILCRNDVKGPEEAARFILDTCFEGSLERYRAHAHDAPSLQDIANHPDSDWKKGTIHGWLRVYDFCERVGRRDWVLGFTHLACVVGLTDLDSAVALLDEAEAKNWSTRQLREAVKKVKPSRRTGRRPDPAYLRTFKAIDRALAIDGPLLGLEEAVANGGLAPSALRQIAALESLLAEVRRVVRLSA